MSLDSSLRTSGDLAGKRSVFKRHERLMLLKQNKDYDPKRDKKPVLGIPKTNTRGVVL